MGLGIRKADAERQTQLRGWRVGPPQYGTAPCVSRYHGHLDQLMSDAEAGLQAQELAQEHACPILRFQTPS